MDGKMWNDLMGAAARQPTPHKSGRYVLTGLVRASLRLAEAYAARLHRQAEVQHRLMVHSPLGAGLAVDCMPEACAQVVWWLARYCQMYGLDLAQFDSSRQNTQWTLADLTGWASHELSRIAELPALDRLRWHPYAEAEMNRERYHTALALSGLLDMAVTLDPGALWRVYMQASEGQLSF
jgi:hypothetical protein